MQKLDPTTWPKVEGDTFPTTGAYWHCYVNGPPAMHHHDAGVIVYRGIKDCLVTHYGPIEFATSDAPETVTLYEISSVGFDGKKWATKENGGCYTVLEAGTVVSNRYATVHRTQTYVKQAATAG